MTRDFLGDVCSWTLAGVALLGLVACGSGSTASCETGTTEDDGTTTATEGEATGDGDGDTGDGDGGPGDGDDESAYCDPTVFEYIDPVWVLEKSVTPEGTPGVHALEIKESALLVAGVYAKGGGYLERLTLEGEPHPTRAGFEKT